MTPTTEELRELAAQKQSGQFSYEPNPNYDGVRTVPHIIRFTPDEKVNKDGTRSIGLSFPVVAATDVVGTPDAVLQSMAAQLNACPTLAAEVFRLREENTAQAERIAELETENADLKAIVIAFCAPFAATYATGRGLPDGHLHPHHYDLLERCGARMDAFTRAALSQEGKGDG